MSTAFITPDFADLTRVLDPMQDARTTRRMRVRATLAALVVFAVLLGESQAVTLTMLPVGDVGNAVDPRPGAHLGAVNYQFWLDKYDVTNAQYVEFLNAKASAADPYGLYDTKMTTFDLGGITRSASAPFAYSIKNSMANKPVVYVSWFDAIRFTNWLTNGQGSGDTESGSYLITGGGPNSGTATIPSAAQRAAWSTTSRHYLLPSADEWHKAGYYKGGGTNAGYWIYPFASDTPPNSGPPGTFRGANVAQFPNTAVPGPIYLTDVGAYNYPGPYGQMDMGGNVEQFTEGALPGQPTKVALRGGAWSGEADGTRYLAYGGTTPDGAFGDFGFRVAAVPEPASVTLVLSACALLVARRQRRRQAS